jgi:hypothetical protein
MNIRSSFLLVFIFLIVIGCDDNPVIDRDKFADYYLVVAEIDSFTNPNWDKYEQFINIKKMRYLIDLAFDREDSVNFGAENCEVSLSYDDSSYQFEDRGNGLYALPLNYPQQNFTFGKEYRLDITFEDGSHAYSVITTPKITFPEVKDTIYVAPDSVLEWTYVPWGSPDPLTVNSMNFHDSIRIQLTEEGFLKYPGTEISFIYHYIFQDDTANTLWLNYRLKNDCLLISSATASPTRFTQKHPIDTINIEFSVEHSAYKNLSILSTDDFWPIKNIVDISNITGAYGIFTSGSYNISKKFILKVKE